MTATPSPGTSGVEQVIYRMRTHPKALFVPVAAAFAWLLAAIACVRYVPSDSPLEPWGLTIALSACGFAFLVFTVVPILRWYFFTFTVTTRNVQIRYGLLNRTGSDIPISRITNVETERGILDRIFGCGTINVTHAASADEGMRLRDVPHAEQVRSTLNEMVYEASMPGQQSGR